MPKIFNNVQKSDIYGSFGEFTTGDGSNMIRAKYLLTKIKPGTDGSWECELADHMKPWREIFNVEELSFDELLQRDIDDSRVAHDLIPYLLSESQDQAKFFPPILAIIVPRKQDGSGIEKFYPSQTVKEGSVKEYGDLFDFEQMKWEDELTPLARMRYNRQRSAFIIVDGQHRAMAVLALHRQLTKSWDGDPFASYYKHIAVDHKQVNGIELPTCIIHFPDLYEGNPDLKKSGVDLSSICREIFLVVNRSAKPVNESRELLLDDADIPAHLMRRTLTTLKDRFKEKESRESARIYSISYGDSDTKFGSREVVPGQLKYSSAITLHKVHAAIFFGAREAFRLKDSYADISDGRRTKNSNRPAEILVGTSLDNRSTLSRNSGKLLPPDEIGKVVKKLGSMADAAMLNLFDKFRPFQIHNLELQSLKTRLLDVSAQAELEQKKAYNLIFEDSGSQSIFKSHLDRLKEEKPVEEQSVSNHSDQIRFFESVQKTFDKHEQRFQRDRACSFFSINRAVFDDDGKQDDQKELMDKARKLFQTLATQAFQLGYAMAVFTVVEELGSEESTSAPLPYQNRLGLVQFVSAVYLTALNRYFSPNENAKHRKLTGYIKEPRVSVFDADSLGLRGLLAMSVKELNERQWRFFRYAILEIVHSKVCWDAAQTEMKQLQYEGAQDCYNWYKNAIPRLAAGILSEREKYITDAVKASVNRDEFKSKKMRAESEAKVVGKSEKEIQQIVKKVQAEHEKKAQGDAGNHLKESLKIVETEEKMVQRLRTGL